MLKKPFLTLFAAMLFMFLFTSCDYAPSQKGNIITFENDYLRYSFKTNGEVTEFTDKSAAKNYCTADKPAYFAYLTEKSGQAPVYPAKITCSGNKLTVAFTNPDVEIILKPVIKKDYITFEVLSATEGDFYSFSFGCANLSIDYTKSDCFGASMLALKVNTDTLAMPGKDTATGAVCYKRTGMKYARAALIGVPEKDMITVMKKVLSSVKSGDMPISKAGGPWAEETAGSKGSYIIVSDNPDLSQADALIAHYKSLNIDQVDFQQGSIFRQGDFVFNCTNGIKGFKKFTDKLHENGLQAGLHTYSQFIDPNSKYISPVPSPDLDAMGWYTLAETIPSYSYDDIKVKEDTSNLSTTTGFFVRNSLYIQIDNEIIQFYGVDKHGFTGITRGALGTVQAEHKKGAKVKHLSQMFNLFMPALDSPLFLEIARDTAKAYNEGGFDMIYLDALDGTYSMVDDQNFAWYYCTLFVNEILKYTDKPPLLEYSCMPNNLWYARSRMGALDTPITGYKQFIQAHCDYNNENAHSNYLPGQLGWISMYPPSVVEDNLPGFQARYMFSEDVDYLGSRAIAWDTGLSYLGTSEDNMKNWPALARNTKRIGLYDKLRNENYFSSHIKDILKAADADFKLEKEGDQWCFYRMNYEKVKLDFHDQSDLTLNNPFKTQIPGLRIESLYSLMTGYDDIDNITLIKFDENKPLAGQNAEAVFEPTTIPLGLGVWVYGNGKGGYISIKLYSPANISQGYAERIIHVDFTGWKYCELVETDNGEIPAARTQSGVDYAEFREPPDFSNINKVNVAVIGDGNGIRLRDIKAIYPCSSELKNPGLSVNGSKITFNVVLASGEYLEYRPGDKTANVYYNTGALATTAKVSGEIELNSNKNNVTFSASVSGQGNSRVRLTSILRGDKVK